MPPAIAPSITRTRWAGPNLSIVAHERWVTPAFLHAVVLLLLQTPLFDAPRRPGLHPALRHLRCRRIKWANRWRASCRFRSRERKECAVIISTPSLVRRFPEICSNRSFTSGGREVDLRTSKRSCTLVADLFTCCPPGPGDWILRSLSSLSSRVIVSVTRTKTSTFR